MRKQEVKQPKLGALLIAADMFGRPQEYLVQMLQKHDGNLAAAATEMKVSELTLRIWLLKYRIEVGKAVREVKRGTK
jgi:transcriptional regulator with PAS, ATPase and Fis domain